MKTIFEETIPMPNNDRGKQLFEAENRLHYNTHFKTTVLRFGGLIGEDRHPIKFLAGKENLENPGAAELLKKYKSDGFGIPVWFIFDANGKLIVDSHLRPEGTGLEVKGQNIIGCPASKEEVKAFTDALKKTSKLNDAELAKIAERFRKNDPKYKG